MRSRDVSAVKIMRVWPFIISLVSVGLVLLFCIGPEAEAQSGGITVGVNCAKGGSINNTLKLKADELTIEIRGVCREDVVISRSNVTLRGVDPDAMVVARSIRAIWIDRASRVTLESLTVRGSTGTTGPTGAGIFVERSTGLTISNVKATENSEGMRTYGSSLRIVDSAFSGNRSGGLYIGNGSSLIIDGDEINVSNNGVYGLCLSESTLRSTWIAYPYRRIGTVYHHLTLLSELHVRHDASLSASFAARVWSFWNRRRDRVGSRGRAGHQETRACWLGG